MRLWREFAIEDLDDIGLRVCLGISAFDRAGDITRLKLTSACHYLDLGCGPCGPLLFIVGRLSSFGFVSMAQNSASSSMISTDTNRFLINNDKGIVRRVS